MFSFLLSFSSIAEYQIVSGISTITSSYKMSEIPDFSCYGSTTDCDEAAWRLSDYVATA